MIIAGPWLTMVGSRLLAGRTSRPAALIAGRRLGDNPRAAFRSVSGLIVALFVTSVAVGVTTTILADHGAPANRAGVSDVLADSFVVNETASGQAISAVAAVPGPVLARLRSIPGVQQVTVIHTNPAGRQRLPPAPFPASRSRRCWWARMGPRPRSMQPGPTSKSPSPTWGHRAR